MYKAGRSIGGTAVGRTDGRLGSAQLDLAWLGSARLGSAQLNSARFGSAQLGLTWLCSARPGPARLGSARLGLAWLCLALLGSALGGHNYASCLAFLEICIFPGNAQNRPSFSI